MIEGARVMQGFVWRMGHNICALADNERHLGHILHIGNHWMAFDGTHVSDDGKGFRIIGSFTSSNAAKAAVEQALSEDVPVIKHSILHANG